MASRTAGTRAIPERRILVGAEWLETGDWIEVRSPYSDRLIARVAAGGAEEARQAIEAASEAMEDPLPAYERAAILDRAAAALRERHEEAALLISDEAGKPIKAARVEAARAASTYELSAAEARKLAGSVIPMSGSQSGHGKLGFTVRRPVGVVGAITPFNFPLNLVAHKIAPALAAGCAVVLKPASSTPLSALLLAGLEQDAGLPPGWLNVVIGESSAIGDALISDPRVAAISFTGSSAVGWGLKQRAPRKRVALELGNATPVIVEADADLGLAATKIAQNAFSYAGQSCISIQRVYVARDVYDRFLEELLPRVESLKVGDPAAEDTDVGPVINIQARDRIIDWIEEARAAGAEVVAGGTAEAGIIRPTVIARASATVRVSCEEVFGPVCTVVPYESLADAFALANGTRYGLQAGIFTRNLENAFRAIEELDFGGVVINEAPTFRADQVPYGGVKDSGNTKEGPAYVVEELTEERLVVIQL